MRELSRFHSRVVEHGYQKRPFVLTTRTSWNQELFESPSIFTDTSRRLYFSAHPSSFGSLRGMIQSVQRCTGNPPSTRHSSLYPASSESRRDESFFRHLWQYAERPYGFMAKETGQPGVFARRRTPPALSRNKRTGNANPLLRKSVCVARYLLQWDHRPV